MAQGVQGKISIAEAKEVTRLMLTVPQRAVPILRGTPGLGKSDIIEQLAIDFFSTYKMGKGCPGCETDSHDPAKHARGCGGHHDPSKCNICAKDRVTLVPTLDDKGQPIPNTVVAKFEPYPAHVCLVDIRLSTFDPIETKGLPYVTGEADSLTKWACPEWLPTDDEIYVILFLDEYLNAPAAVQNASLQLIYDRKIHTHKLGRRVAIALAGNTEGDGSYITRLGGAAKNRLAHLEIETDAKSWMDWARANDVLPEIIGAVEYKPDTFMPTEFNRDADAQSTPRTITMVSNLVRQSGARTDREIRRIANPLIGNGATHELIAYISQYQKIKPQEILDGKFPTFEKEQASHRYAAATAFAYYVHKNPERVKDKAHVDNLVRFLELLGPELSVKCLADFHLAQHSTMVMTILKHCSPAFRQIMSELAGALSPASDETPASKRKAR